MFQVILKIAVIASLIILFIQDIKRREVSFYLLLSSFLLVLTLGLVSSINITGIAVNILFIVLQVGFLVVYLFFTGRKPKMLLKSFMGIGDILFLLVPAFYFKPVEFILFSLVCYMSIVIGYGILYSIRRRSSTIPLAGFMALFMAIYIIAGWYNSDLFTNLFSNFLVI